MVIASTNPPNLTDATKTRFTLDEYRAIEETAEERHEYCNGEMIAMSGGSPAHSRIAVDITTFLNVALRDTNFQTYNGDLRIWIPSFNHGTYPDVTVIDGEPELNGDRTDEILNPLLIVEVLSPSTEAYDRGEKFRKYRSLASFCEYLLVSQTEPYIEQYHNLDRQSSDRWQWQVYDGIDRAIVLHSLNIELPMSEVYRRLNF
ncbi:MAG: Uma2 family endonuclease [Microcoleus sp.]